MIGEEYQKVVALLRGLLSVAEEGQLERELEHGGVGKADTVEQMYEKGLMSDEVVAARDYLREQGGGKG